MNIVTFPYELYFAPASNLVAKLLAREVSSTKLTVALYERIGKLNLRLNAMVTLCQKRALKLSGPVRPEAGSRDDIRPLEDLPISIRECISRACARPTG
jgi:Asp-tRNA(Asn)/Glu-tRNA(Gln) amidotransferase A subunit family amidase